MFSGNYISKKRMLLKSTPNVDFSLQYESEQPGNLSKCIIY